MPSTVERSLFTTRDPALSQTLLDAVQVYNPDAVGFDGAQPVFATAKAGDGVFAMAPVSLPGTPVPTFYDDWYFRIHLIPAALNLGNLVSEQQRSVFVWNAYPSAQALIDTPIDGGEGIDITAPGVLPLAFAALQMREWVVNISVEGPATIAAVWTFQFTGLEAETVTITGDRVVPWTFAPDWGDGMLERLGWLTDVMTSPTRAEQRRALRLSPTRSFELRSILEGAERTAFDLAVSNWGGRTWAMPVWPDIVWLGAALPVGSVEVPCDTAGRDFVAGGIALLRAADMHQVRRYEVVEVESIGAGALTLRRPTLQAWSRGSRLYPLRLAQFPQQPQVRRITDTAIEVRYQFEVTEPCDWPALMPATLYRGVPVLEQVPDESGALTVNRQRAQSTMPHPTGFARRTDTADTPATLQQHRWLLAGRPAQAGYRSLLYGLQGQFKALWLPTFSADLTVLAPISASSIAVDIAAVDYPRFGAGRVGRRDIRIELVGGVAFHRRIDAASTLDDETERLILDAALGVDVTVASIRRVSFMELSTQATDTTEISHRTDADGVAAAALVFRSIRDDV